MGVHNYYCSKCNTTKVVEHSSNTSPFIKCDKCSQNMLRIINNGSKNKRSGTNRQKH